MCQIICGSLLVILATLCLIPGAKCFGYQLCDWCPTELRNNSEVVRTCHASHQELRGRCCLSKQDDCDIIVGLDLWNCSLTHLGSEIENASSAIILDLSGNNLQNLSATLFKGFTSLQYIALPAGFSCPGGNSSWYSIKMDMEKTVCQNQSSTCNGTGELAFLCPENSLCAPDGPGFFKCLCAEGYHGYKCLREGTFPVFMFFGILGSVTFIVSLFLWYSQRRKVKSS